VKDQKVMGTSDYHWQNEPVLYGIKPDKELAKRIIETLEKELGITLQVYDTYHQSAIYGWKKGGSHRWSSDRSQSTVLNYNRTKLNDLHPTMKPVTLLKYLIHNSSIEREIIADAFLGSGSTLIAADETDRRCYGMELDPPNVDIAVRRWVATRIQKDQVWTISKNGKDISSQKWLTDGQKATAQTS
jgi:DNA modification methylase